jgi:hypothetical protein
MMPPHSDFARRTLLTVAGLAVSLVIHPCFAQSIAWPTFGPERPTPRLDGLTDTLPDFIGPIDGSAELTIFSEGNHYPVLLPLVLDAFPAWCRRTGACRIDPGRILVVTLPQAMIVDTLLTGGIRLGNAFVPVGRGQRVFPDIVMAGRQPLSALASAGIVGDRAVAFARHRGLGLLLRRDLSDVDDVAAFQRRAERIVLASESEPGARNQYRATLNALIGTEPTTDLMNREIRTFPGRLGIQHRDVPYAVLNGLADGGIIFSHLAAFYARTYPDRLRFVNVPAAEGFGQELALARTKGGGGPLIDAFERFFLDAAGSAYPSGGFADPATFKYGAELDLSKR